MVTDPGGQPLTARERQVVEAAVTGASVQQIAKALSISTRTAEHHLTQAYRKRGVRSRTELIAQGAGAKVVVHETRYATCNGSGIAYQVVGSGTHDVVFVPGFVSNVESGWTWPSYAAFLNNLAQGRRLILFDKLGTGMSDRLTSPGKVPFEERMEEVRVVMDAAQSKRATIIGFSEGGALAMLFAATYPERVNGLVLYAPLVSVEYHAPTSALALSRRDPDAVRALFLASWGSGFLAPAWPGVTEDPANLAHLARFERTGAGPADAFAIVEQAAGIEMRSLVSAVTTPTLVLHRTKDTLVPVANSHYLRDHLPFGRLVELPGLVHVPWIGPGTEMWQELDVFLAADHPVPAPQTATLTTLAFVEPLLAPRHLPFLTANHGRAVGTDQGLAYVFSGPSAALTFARSLRLAAPTTRIALHCGETTSQGHGLQGPAIRACQRILSASAPGEVLVSRALREFLHGAAVTCDSTKSIDLDDDQLEVLTLGATT